MSLAEENMEGHSREHRSRVPVPRGAALDFKSRARIRLAASDAMSPDPSPVARAMAPDIAAARTAAAVHFDDVRRAWRLEEGCYRSGLGRSRAQKDERREESQSEQE